MAKDYDQFLTKKPGKSDAVFAWHQDMAYWPPTSLTPGLATTHTLSPCCSFLPTHTLSAILRNPMVSFMHWPTPFLSLSIRYTHGHVLTRIRQCNGQERVP